MTNEAWAQALAKKRSRLLRTPPKAFLDLQLRRRVKADCTFDFLGRACAIAPTGQHAVCLIHHPQKHSWVPPHPPTPTLADTHRLYRCQLACTPLTIRLSRIIMPVLTWANTKSNLRSSKVRS